ncbi:DUF881 domain-containing protein [Clostridium sp. SYSU_GA19001]|uniref:DUF881 domain-containing protein n=1 Tax=Clostridium caldaquaticum TaxID=2940653 RepID=UPI002077514B|nr:DUF881 domain-containing protein [Clostridium caldaquaticum]MCM8711009.1 DUF881 domain-containing protein [Clostridium caldaquaticum]
MTKYKSQITVALVCCILGFMLAYQFKILNKRTNSPNLKAATTDITVEIEQYKKEKEELQKSINDLQAKLKKYEDAAASRSDETKNIVEELEKTRLLTGTKDVEGPGIILYLNPKTKILGNDIPGEHITDKHLIYIVNELISAGAEAISINDARITPRTGIRTSGNNILINEERISPFERITIKAIGNKELLYKTLDFPGVFTDFLHISTPEYERYDKIEIKRYNKSFKFEYAKPIKG